jgi:hypothetical protein
MPPTDRTRKASRDLFTPVVSVDNLDESFRDVALQPGHEAAQAMINTVFANFHDVDHSFVREFQTAGFSARVFELALFAYIEEQNLALDRTSVAPDFVLRGQHPVAIEVTTTNPAQGRSYDDSAQTTVIPSDLPGADREFVFQMGKALRRKLLHRDASGHAYWEKPHVSGAPFVIAVGAFHNEHAQFHPDGLLARYLYGVDQTLSLDRTGTLVISQHQITDHSFGDRTIPSALFRQPDAANLSGVLFSNSHTIAKFNRVGTELGMGSPETALVRFGTCYNHEPGATEPDQFAYIVGERPNEALETFAEGLHLFINPWATHPLLPAALPNIVVYSMRDNGTVIPDIPGGFLPLISKTFTVVGQGAQLAARQFKHDYVNSVLAVIEERRRQ